MPAAGSITVSVGKDRIPELFTDGLDMRNPWRWSRCSETAGLPASFGHRHLIWPAGAGAWFFLRVLARDLVVDVFVSPNGRESSQEAMLFRSADGRGMRLWT